MLNVSLSAEIKMEPPKAKKELNVTKIHGIELKDEYYWLRNKTNPEVIEYLKAENEYSEEFMKDTKDFQEQLFQEMVGRIKETDLSVPVQIDNYFYYSRTEKGKQYPIQCRKAGSMNGKEEILLDENILAEGKPYFDLGSFSVSPDHRLLAYSVDTTGSEEYTIYVKNIETGEIFIDEIKNVSSDFIWANDNKTFYYTTLNEVQQADKVFRHTLGQTGMDELIYHETDNAYFLNLDKTKDESTIIIMLSSKDESEIWTLDANNPKDKAGLIKKREKGFEYYLECHTDQYYIWTNYKAENFRIMTVEKSQPDFKNWKEFMPYNEKIRINSVEPFKNFIVIHLRKDGIKQMMVHNVANGKKYFVEFPEKVYTYNSSLNPDFNRSIIRFSYSSMITPNTVYDYDMRDRNFELLKQTEVLGGYDKNDYVTEQIFARSQDGIEVPVTLVYKKGIKKDSSNPAYLYSYGSYGYPTEPYFSSVRLTLLERGFVCGIAHIRGGGEMGETWYKDGKMMNKKNTFFDFIAASEELIKLGYTNKEKLVIEGGSAGGLLMGAVTNMRPDLYKVVLANVPFVDIINTMLDETIPLTVAEYTEWGNPNEKKYFDYMLSYSPYDNIKKQDYPNILVRAGLNDPRVPYWEPAKYTAILREMKTDSNSLLLVTNMDAGHGGSSGRYSKLREDAFDYAFIFKILRIEK